MARGEIFSSRASLDTLFKPFSTGFADFTDVLVIGFEDGTLHLSISDQFSIGNFELKEAEPNLQCVKPLLHYSHPLCTTHAVLVTSETERNKTTQVVPVDLRLISSAGRHLSLLASKVTHLHNLLRYIRQVQNHISFELQTSQELPNRFMEQIREALKEKSDYTWVHAAYHLVVTGHCFPEVKDWLVDSLGERVSKRRRMLVRAILSSALGPQAMG